MSEATSAKQTLEIIDEYLGKPIDGFLFKTMTQAGLTWLRTNQQIVNRINHKTN